MPTRSVNPALMIAIGNLVRQTREACQLSQERLARAAGVSQGAISRLEAAKGASTPFLVVFNVIAALQQHAKRLPREVLAAPAAWMLSLPLDKFDPKVAVTAVEDPFLRRFLLGYYKATEAQRAVIQKVAPTLLAGE